MPAPADGSLAEKQRTMGGDGCGLCGSILRKFSVNNERWLGG
jgi:hypothetical protein